MQDKNTQLIETALKYHGKNPGNWTLAWCAAFLNMVLEENEVPGTNSLMARSFIDIGSHADDRKLGDIVVLWRVKINSPWGHAGIYINEDEHNIALLGGNQDGTVKIKSYPKWQLLDVRRVYV